jgi:hypothetical protein
LSEAAADGRLIANHITTAPLGTMVMWGPSYLPGVYIVPQVPRMTA